MTQMEKVEWTGMTDFASFFHSRVLLLFSDCFLGEEKRKRFHSLLFSDWNVRKRKKILEFRAEKNYYARASTILKWVFRK